MALGEPNFPARGLDELHLESSCAIEAHKFRTGYANNTYRNNTSLINPAVNGSLVIRTRGWRAHPARINDGFFLGPQKDDIGLLLVCPEVINAARTVHVNHHIWLKYAYNRVATGGLHLHAGKTLAIFEQLPYTIRTIELDLQIDGAEEMDCDAHRNMWQVALLEEVQRVGQIITQSQERLTVEIENSVDLSTDCMLLTFTASSEQCVVNILIRD